MLFTEKDLLNCFRANVDNKGWIYFVGNLESNAKFIIDYMKAHKEVFNEDELDELAREEYPEEYTKIPYHDMVDSEVLRMAFKAACRKILDVYYLRNE